MLKSMNNCYICKSRELRVIKERLRYNIKRNVLECQKCGLVFLEPKKENLQKYYEKDYRKLYTPVIGKEVDSKGTFELYYPLQRSRVEMVKRYLSKEKRVLDIGCSAGHFLFSIKNMVKECVGLEFNAADAKFVNEELGIKVYTEPIEKTDLSHKYFDVIFCLQTLEHIDDPVKLLKTIRKYLKDDGIVYIEVPNVQEAILSVYKNKEFHDFYFREPHLFYYSPKNFAALMKKAGYKGSVLPFQWYNFLNQMHWMFAKGAQKSAVEGLSDPVLVVSEDVPKKIRDALNKWIKKADQEYKSILNQYSLSNSIVFVGGKCSDLYSVL